MQPIVESDAPFEDQKARRCGEKSESEAQAPSPLSVDQKRSLPGSPGVTEDNSRAFVIGM
jgi:hypothetical protein